MFIKKKKKMKAIIEDVLSLPLCYSAANMKGERKKKGGRKNGREKRRRRREFWTTTVKK